MKSLLKQFSAVSCLALLGAAFVPPSLGQSETGPQKEISKSQPRCPTVSVSCPSHNEDDKAVPFTVTVNGADAGVVLTYTWTASLGTIVEGQGTPTIKLNTEGFGFSSITATVTIGGLNSSCGSIASCSILRGHLPPPSSKLDSYGLLPRSKEKERLKIFATALENNPGTQGYVLSYHGRRGVAAAAREAGDRAKAYLVNKLGIPTERIVTLEGGFKEELTVDLWIVPAGATPPKPEPTIDRLRSNR
jgi:hypothetical protein